MSEGGGLFVQGTGCMYEGVKWDEKMVVIVVSG
jgi:hypothetical protein